MLSSEVVVGGTLLNFSCVLVSKSMEQTSCPFTIKAPIDDYTTGSLKCCDPVFGCKAIIGRKGLKTADAV